MRDYVIKQTKQHKIIAIVRGIDGSSLENLADALYQGGIRMMEVTFDMLNPTTHENTAHSIARLAKHTEGRMLIGAGTVTSPQLVDLAHAAKAQYIVSPDTNPAVISRTREMGLVSMPGAFTATEIVTAYSAGADFVKVFPATTGGPSYFKALRGPLPHIPLLAVGGINEDNIKNYLDAGAAGAGVGGNLVNKKWIADGAFDRITALARALYENAK